MKSRWICKKCDRLRSTNYCHECGSKKPDQKTLAISISSLKKAARKHRIQEQRLHNQIKTLIEKRSNWNLEKFKLKEYEHKEFADAIELAIKIINAKWGQDEK